MVDVFFGRIDHFPEVAVDYFAGACLKCHHFFLTHCHTDHIKGIDSVEFRRHLAAKSSVKIYASVQTISLVLRRSKLEYLRPHFIPVSVGATDTLTLPSGDTVIVRTYEANHCPGAVMFLFQNAKHKTLYTGDFRFHPALLTEDFTRNAAKVDTLYLDTTFYNPHVHQFRTFPSRIESENQTVLFILNQLDRNKKSTFHIDVMPGWEHIFIACARKLDIKIQTSHEILEEYHDLKTISTFLTLEKSMIHINKTSAECNLCYSDSVRLRPSIQWKIHNNAILDSAFISPRIGTECFYYITNSIHSSYEELEQFLSHVSASVVYPIVIPSNMAKSRVSQLLQKHCKQSRVCHEDSEKVVVSCQQEVVTLTQSDGDISSDESDDIKPVFTPAKVPLQSDIGIRMTRAMHGKVRKPLENEVMYKTRRQKRRRMSTESAPKKAQITSFDRNLLDSIYKEFMQIDSD